MPLAGFVDSLNSFVNNTCQVRAYIELSRAKDIEKVVLDKF